MVTSYSFSIMSELVESRPAPNLAQEIQQEMPTIYVSVKQLITSLLGKNAESPLEPKILPQNVITCAKYLLQSIGTNSDSECERKGSPENQISKEQFDELCKYKVVNELQYKASQKAAKNKKSYFHWSKHWKVYRKKTKDMLQENTHIPLQEIELFLQSYESSMNLKGE